MTPFAVIGWIVGAVFFGLWLGERGRRRDAQWITEAAVGPREPERSSPSSRSEAALSDVEDASRRLREAEIDELVGIITEETLRSGVEATPDEIRQEAERLASRLEGTIDPEALEP